MTGQTVILTNRWRRNEAKNLIDMAPYGHILNIRPPSRSKDQNDKMWAMIGDVSRAKPEGRRMTSDEWKAVFMHACGYEVQYLNGLNDRPFPVGFSSSKLSKEQMSDLIEFIAAWGAQHGVVFRDDN